MIFPSHSRHQGSNKSAAVTASEGEAAQSQFNMNLTRTDTQGVNKAMEYLLVATKIKVNIEIEP